MIGFLKLGGLHEEYKLNGDEDHYGCDNGIKLSENHIGRHSRWIRMEVTTTKIQNNTENEAVGNVKCGTGLFKG